MTLETTALGAAYLAGLAVGYWGSQADINSQWQEDRTFRPAMEPAKVAERTQAWNRALRAAISWAKP